MNDYRELARCWGSLLIAICYEKEITPEESFNLWDIGKCRNYKDSKLNETIIEARKDGMTFKEIGKLVGLSKMAAFKRVDYYAPELINRKEKEDG